MILGLLPPLYLKKIKSLNSQSAKAKAEALFSCSKKEAIMWRSLQTVSESLCLSDTAGHMRNFHLYFINV